MTNERERRIQRILIGVIVFLLSFILLTSVLYVRSTRPMRQAKEEATTIAKKYAKLETVDRFYWFNRQLVYAAKFFSAKLQLARLAKKVSTNLGRRLR